MQKAVIQRKADEVKILTEKLQNAKTVVVFDYPGLSVFDFTTLRNQLRENGCEVKVYKNNITRRASIEAGYNDLVDTLKGAKAVAISSDDVVAPAKIVYDFARENKQVKITSGVIEGKVVDVEELNVLATLPSRETLLTMLAAGLLNPVQQIAIGLHMLEEQKQ